MLKRVLQAAHFPLFLLVISITSYGLLSPWLGFHWDDWQAVWWKHTFGASGFFEYFSGDRPPLAIIYYFTHSLLSTDPLQWQIAALLSRWLAAVLLWWTLKQIWRNQPELTAWAALLFVVYPGFKQQPVSVVWTNGILLFAAQFLSWGVMLKALQHKGAKGYLLTAISLLSLALCIFSTEYFIGLEALRPVLIWLSQTEKSAPPRQRLRWVLRQWLPYLMLLACYAVWRVLVIGFPTYQPSLVEAVSNGEQSNLITQIFKIPYNLLLTSWIAWSETFRFPLQEDMTTASSRLHWLIVLATAIFTFLYLKNFNRLGKQTTQSDADPLAWDSASLQIIRSGLLVLCSAGLPFWIADLPIETRFPYDRFTLAFIPGCALLMVGLLQWIMRRRLQKIIFLSLLVSMAVGSNFSSTVTFRREWETQKNFFWQLSWRAPQIVPGTFLLAYALPFQYSSDNSLTAPLNWLYAPQHNSLDLPYFLGYMPVRMGRSLPKAEDLQPGLPIRQGYRSAMFQGNTSNMLLIHYSPPGCVRVINPLVDRDIRTFPREIEEILSFSNTAQIDHSPSQPAVPPAHIFGDEPPHNTWCYFFEKAELARQRSDWQQVVELGNQAFGQGLAPTEMSEMLVFIDGYAQYGDWEKSLELTVQTFQAKPDLHLKLCFLMGRLHEEHAPSQRALEALRKTKEFMDCQ
ncbi:MAG: hypothetical protein HPY45_16400 [Anaerolineae bacterium]|nr:hypothetical protein [Anaerolineae bacterium]